MIIVHAPSPTDIENQYGYWSIVGDHADFNAHGLPIESVTAQDISANPLHFSQIRYWQGPEDEMVRLIKDLHPGYPGNPDHRSTEDMGRALFGA